MKEACTVEVILAINLMVLNHVTQLQILIIVSLYSTQFFRIKGRGGARLHSGSTGLGL